ncbi:hypothetical protein [Pleomorphomonas sp. PLEO]|uniref:hypothetical protein n=1 Tax=Pleomorphomonas sp. PLEO TaxID=3239306 RepID=UPI00351EECA5
MTDAAESFPSMPAPRRFVFTTGAADALALEAVLKPADRSWRSLLGYAFALPPLIVVSWFTRNADWPVWFASFGLIGLVAWQGARFVLKAEKARAARQHPIGAGQVDFTNGRFEGAIGGVAIAIPAVEGVRVEMDAGHLYILADNRPALVLPLSAFAGRADLIAFAASFKEASRRPGSLSASD